MTTKGLLRTQWLAWYGVLAVVAYATARYGAPWANRIFLFQLSLNALLAVLAAASTVTNGRPGGSQFGRDAQRAFQEKMRIWPRPVHFVHDFGWTIFLVGAGWWGCCLLHLIRWNAWGLAYNAKPMAKPAAAASRTQAI
ncbi:MAG: hypothetical protein ABI629_16330 [bacterium]